MAYTSGFNPRNIENFTKITDLKNMKNDRVYLVRYSTLGKPRLFHIARFKNMKIENDSTVYWFDSLYIKRPTEIHWQKTLDHRPHIAFDSGELYIDEGFINRDYEPYSIYDEGYDFAIFEVGQYGNRINEDVGPEDVLSLIISQSKYSVKKTPKHARSRIHGGKKTKKNYRVYKKTIKSKSRSLPR